MSHLFTRKFDPSWNFKSILSYASISTRTRTYYEILEVPRNCSNEDIKAAYKKLSKKNHPDTAENGSDKNSHESFVEISEAYQTLIKADTRREYDRKIGNYGSEQHMNDRFKRYEARPSSSYPKYYNADPKRYQEFWDQQRCEKEAERVYWEKKWRSHFEPRSHNYQRENFWESKTGPRQKRQDYWDSNSDPLKDFWEQNFDPEARQRAEKRKKRQKHNQNEINEGEFLRYMNKNRFWWFIFIYGLFILNYWSMSRTYDIDSLKNKDGTYDEVFGFSYKGHLTGKSKFGMDHENEVKPPPP